MDEFNVMIIPKTKFFELLENVKDDTKLPTVFKDALEGEKYKNSDFKLNLTINDVKELHSTLRDASCDLYVHELLRETSIELPTPKIAPRNPELEKRIEKLKLDQENKEYRNMTRNIDTGRRHEDSGLSDLNKDLKLIRAQLISVVNFVLTVGGSFVFGYKLVEYSLPQPHIPAQVLIGIILATIVAVADLYFLLKQIAV